MTDYKKLLEKFLKEESNRQYALPIFERLTQAIRHGEIADIRKRGREEIVKRMPEIFEKMKDDALKKKRYVAHIFPTTISPEQAPNFYIGKEVPTEEEIYRFFYLIISGIYKGPYIINIDNVDKKIRDEFRSYLIREEKLILPGKKGEGVNIPKILNDLGIPVAPQLDDDNEFIYSFIIFSAFASWIKKIEERENLIKEIEELGLSSMLEKIGISDDATLIIFYIPKQKKEMYVIPKIKNLLLTWYEDYIKGKEDYPSVVKFIFSNYIADKQYRKLSATLLNKFLYYFLNGYVNGELLNKLVNTKIYYEFGKKSKRIYGFVNSKQFFSRISRNIFQKSFILIKKLEDHQKT
jgi:hypothetical protein